MSVPKNMPRATGAVEEPQPVVAYCIGDLIFARVRGYPPWPARVEGLAPKSRDGVKYVVTFFGTYERATCDEANLFHYELHKDIYSKSRRRGFSLALQEIQEAARERASYMASLLEEAAMDNRVENENAEVVKTEDLEEMEYEQEVVVKNEDSVEIEYEHYEHKVEVKNEDWEEMGYEQVLLSNGDFSESVMESSNIPEMRGNGAPFTLKNQVWDGERENEVSILKDLPEDIPENLDLHNFTPPAEGAAAVAARLLSSASHNVPLRKSPPNSQKSDPLCPGGSKPQKVLLSNGDFSESVMESSNIPEMRGNGAPFTLKNQVWDGERDIEVSILKYLPEDIPENLDLHNFTPPAEGAAAVAARLLSSASHNVPLRKSPPNSQKSDPLCPGGSKPQKVWLSNGGFSESCMEIINSTEKPNTCRFSNIPEMAGSGTAFRSQNLVCVVEREEEVSIMKDVPEDIPGTLDVHNLTPPPEGTTAVATHLLSYVSSNVPLHNSPPHSQKSDPLLSGGSKSQKVHHPKDMYGSEVNSCPNSDLEEAQPSSAADTAREPSDSSSSPEGEFLCSVCGRTSRSLLLLMKHEKLHEKNSLLNCDTCNKSFSTKGSLQRHSQSHVKLPVCKTGSKERYAPEIDRSTLEQQKDLVCNSCNKSFLSKYHLRVHLRVHMKEKPYCCTICGKQYIQSAHLKQHELTHSSTKSLNCRECGRRFSRRDSLKRHLKMHIGNKSGSLRDHVQSRTCEKPDVREHCRAHSTSKPFICSLCGGGFRSERVFKAHLHTHSAKKTFKCEVCGREFSLHCHLKSHSRIHSVEMPFACALCNRKFRHEHTLQVHKRLHL